MERPVISVVVPAYGCESCLVPLHAALAPVLDGIATRWELVIVEDHSPQQDWQVIETLAAKDPRVRGVKLTRNFGQHSAIAAGLAEAEGDWIVVMDCDLQDRPAEIAVLHTKAQEGFDCVFGRRANRQDHASKVAVSRLFSFLHGRVAKFEADAAVGNFSIISRRVVLELRKFREGRRNYALQVHWLGFPTAYVDIEHAARHSGKSTYSFARQLKHAVATVLSQSTRPLYASVAFGFFAAGGAAITGIYLIIRKLTGGVGVEGWTGVMVSLWFLFGVLFVNLGVIGLYLGSVFDEVKGRPPFVIERTTYPRVEGHSTGASRMTGERGA